MQFRKVNLRQQVEALRDHSHSGRERVCFLTKYLIAQSTIQCDHVDTKYSEWGPGFE